MSTPAELRGEVPTPPIVRGTRRILFVCLGNICRSPLAQGVFEHLLIGRGLRGQFTVESCGIGDWHAGELPDPRMRDTALRNGVTLCSRARQIDPRADFERFELVLAMDRRNLRAINQHGAPVGRAHLFLAFAPRGLAEPHGFEVPDPYYGGPEGFEEVYRLVHAGAQGLLDAVL